MKNTKKSLVLSLLSLLLCVSMLIGTTFAWFTDSVTSGVNTIVAGNLDIDVQYKNDNVNDWKDLQGSDTVFSKGLWEPGHTEFVTLKISNKGTLALKYRMNVSPIDEVGGINVQGNSFKLSDYLVFGSTTPSDTQTVYTRDTARAAVGTTMGLTQSSLTQNQTMLPGEIDYITLVVYMPETVGNEANYKTGTTAPSIDLGIKFLATQLESESDSFGNDYDKDVDYDASAAALEYNYFPQVDVTGQLEIDGTEVKKGSAAGSETSVTKLSDTTSKVVLASPDTIEDNTAAKVTTVLNKGTLNDDETGSLTLKVVKDDIANANFQATNTSDIDTEKQDSTTYQVTVKTEGVVAIPETEGKAKFKVDLFIGKNRKNVKMFHSGNAMTKAETEVAETYTYNSETGYVSMFVDNFSPFTSVYDLPVASIGTTVYYSLQAAVDAAGTTATTIKLIDNAQGDGVDVKENQNITFDFCGHTYTLQGEMVGSSGTKTNGFRFLQGSTVILKNGKLANGTVSQENNTPAKVMVNSYAALTLTDFSIDATTTAVPTSGSPYGTGCLYISNGPAIVTGKGTYTGDPDGYVIYMANVEYYNDGAALTFDENFVGTVSGKVTDGGKQAASISIKNGNYNFSAISFNNGTMLASGGTFSSVLDNAYIASQHKIVENGNGTWSVVPKVTPKPDSNGVFTVGTNEDLEAVLNVLNTDADYSDKPYTIKLGSGVTGATYDENTKKYIANVYVIPQYIGWRYNNNTDYKQLIAGKKARVTIIGDTGSDKLTFRGIFVVTGHGYSNGGDDCYDPNAATTIQNLNFDFTDVVGVSGATTGAMSGPKYNPIIACGACSNLTIDNCNFKNTERVKIGYSQNNNLPGELYNNEGLVCQFRGYAFCTVISKCNYESVACIADGYPSGRSNWTTTNGKYGLRISNVNATGMTSGGVNTQTGGGADILIENCNISGSGYGVRLQGGNTALVKDTSIYISGRDNNIIAFKGNGNNTITLENVTIPEGGSVNVEAKNTGNRVICKGTTPVANTFTKTGSGEVTISDEE